MVKRVIIIVTIIFFSIPHLYAQIKIEIDSVKIEKEYESQYKPSTGVGSAVTVINKGEVERNISRTLSELLVEGSSLQIKSMGQGSLATISFRGTSSSHTKVLWNGIPLNPPQLGTFDFSQVPVYFTDGVALYHGGSIAESGSGAVGGSVSFKNSDREVTNTEISIIAEAASNNTYSGGVNIRHTFGSLTSVTRAFYQESENNYLYLNKVYSKEYFYERRENAEYVKTGIMQEFYYRTKKLNKIYAIGWWQYDDRALPQPIMVNTVSRELTTDNSFRAVAGYDIIKSTFTLKSSIAYLNNKLHYIKEMGDYGNVNTLNRGSSIMAKSSLLYNKLNNIVIGADFNYRNDWIVSDNFKDETTKRETLSLRGYIMYRPHRRVSIDGQATIEVVNSKEYGVYGVTARYFVIDNFLTLKSSHSYNLRIPTLNDLYWYPGGNPDLLPETGRSWDFTIESNPRFGLFDIDFFSSLYYSNIDNWIMWTPSGDGAIWSPKNLKNVISKGLEAGIDIKYDNDTFSHAISFNYTYAHSTDNSGIEGTQGKQLIYIPRNRWSAGYDIRYKERLWLHYNANFTDVRFTSDDESYFTNPYYLHNVEVGYKFKLLNHKLSLSFKVENIFNSYYESTEYYPMPLRMFWSRLIINF